VDPPGAPGRLGSHLNPGAQTRAGDFAFDWGSRYQWHRFGLIQCAVFEPRSS